MKKIIITFYLLFFMLSCNKSKDTITPNTNNPFLPNYSFTINVDLDLPSNSQLTFAGNGIRIQQNGVGIRGIFVFNTGTGYTAFDLACPNQDLSTCSTMTINGINGVCPCDNTNYSLYTGQAAGKQYPLKQYRTEVNGSVVRVFN